MFQRNVLLTDFSTLKLEAIHSSETSVHTRTTWRHIDVKVDAAGSSKMLVTTYETTQ
jgi:hypothetical protein